MPPPSNVPEHITNSGRPTSPSLFQRLGSFDLFNNLLSNRERVYQSLRRFSPIRTSTVKGEEDRLQHQSIEGENRVIQSIEFKEEETDYIENDSMRSYLKETNMAVTRSKGRPPKKAPAKAKPKGKLGLTATRKRNPPVTNKTERASKVQKRVPKANSGKRVNGRGASMTDAYIISDDDDDDDSDNQLRQESRTDSLTPPQQTFKIDTPGSEDDLNPAPAHSKKLENELVTHSKELEHLRQQLTASEAKVKQVKKDAEREALELQRRQSVTNDKHMADLGENLEAERRLSSDLSWECDHLRREMEAARSCLKRESDLILEREEYERLYKEEQDTNADLMRSLTEKNEEAARKTAEIAKEIQQLAKQIEDLQREVTQLKDENTSLKALSSSQTTESRSSATPTPSQSSTAPDAEQRHANVRKTYVTVKRRYDILHAIAANISTTTRSWDYGSFGEFGQYLRQLKAALDENSQGKQAAGLGGSVAKAE